MVVGIVGILFLSGGVFAAQPQKFEAVPGELLVKFHLNATQAEKSSLLKMIQGKIKKKMQLSGITLIEVPVDTVKKAIRRLELDSLVEYAEPNYIRFLNQTGTRPNDQFFRYMWGLDNVGQFRGTASADIDAPLAWTISTGSPDTVVAVIDSGVDLQHVDLAANIWVNPGEIPDNGIDDDGNGYIDDVHGWDFISNDNDPSDDDSICEGHGTHTSGTIGAVGNNGIGVTGVSWNVRVMPLKIFKKFYGVICSSTSAAIIEAVEYATTMGVKVSNNSYGGSQFSQAEYEAIQYSNMLFVAAAGNEASNNDFVPSYPASYDLDNIISVAATDNNDALAYFSNFGSSVDIAAPGVNIGSTLPENRYTLYSGTSMASPFVAGAAGLLLAVEPQLFPSQLKWYLMNGAEYKGLPILSGGRLNVYYSLTLLLPNVALSGTERAPQ